MVAVFVGRHLIGGGRDEFHLAVENLASACHDRISRSSLRTGGNRRSQTNRKNQDPFSRAHFVISPFAEVPVLIFERNAVRPVRAGLILPSECLGNKGNVHGLGCHGNPEKSAWKARVKNRPTQGKQSDRKADTCCDRDSAAVSRFARVVFVSGLKP